MSNSGSVPNPHKLDESELKIVRLMDSNARMTYTDFAARLGVGRATAKAMVDRLYKKGAQTVCYVDEWVRGYRNSIVFCINTDPAALFDVANGLASMDEIQSVMLFAGPFDILATAVFKGQHQIPKFVSEELGRLRGIVRHESIMYHEIKPGHPARHHKIGGAASLDDLDIALIKELEKNARESATALAAKLGTTRTTVVRRLNKLIEDKVLSFQTIWGNYMQGYRGVAFVGIKASPSKISDVGRALAGYEQVRSVSLCNGRYDVLAWITFEEQAALINFLDDEVGRIQGLASIESGIALTLIKYDIGRVLVR